MSDQPQWTHVLVTKLPLELKKLISFLEERGFFLVLVGGTVRDYLLNATVGHDLDFELRFNTSLSDKAWKNKIKVLFSELEDLYDQVELLDFLVIRLKVGEYDFELSSPRMEVYPNKKTFGHSDFKASFSSEYSYEESFRRRDFSINAMGVELKKEGPFFVDPFSGEKDLKEGILRVCDDKNFIKDPVRFLRAIRFKQRFDFKYSDQVLSLLKKFNLEKLSTHYFFSETLKGLFFDIGKEFFSLTEEHSIKLNASLKELSFLKNFSYSKKIHSLQEAAFVLAFLSASAEYLHTFSSHAGVKKSFYKDCLGLKKRVDENDSDLDEIKQKVQESNNLGETLKLLRGPALIFKFFKDYPDLLDTFLSLSYGKVSLWKNLSDMYALKADKKIYEEIIQNKEIPRDLLASASFYALLKS